MKARAASKKRQNTGILVTIALAVILALVLRQAYSASQPTLSLSSPATSYRANSTFTVTVYEDSGTHAINAVEADLTYDAAKLEYVSMDFASSAFDAEGGRSGGNGSVKIGRAKLGGSLTGKQIVGTVTFKALASSGTTTLDFAPTSAIVRQSDLENIWKSGGGSKTMVKFTR